MVTVHVGAGDMSGVCISAALPYACSTLPLLPAQRSRAFTPRGFTGSEYCCSIAVVFLVLRLRGLPVTSAVKYSHTTGYQSLFIHSAFMREKSDPNPSDRLGQDGSSVAAAAGGAAGAR